MTAVKFIVGFVIAFLFTEAIAYLGGAVDHEMVNGVSLLVGISLGIAVSGTPTVDKDPK